MFNYLSLEFVNFFSYFNLFNYITFRTGAAILTSLFFSLIFGEIIINSYTLSTQDISPINIGLPYPNPTTSIVALNSSKDYNIEIFDMAGNKVMETSGNTIDMSVLSSAMYIVKAFDKATKETESYKVVKN